MPYKQVQIQYGAGKQHRMVQKAGNNSKQIQIFKVEDMKVVMTHIGGYPNAYAPGIKQLLMEEKPDIFISGHSHILKVMRDQQLGLLHLNPGAAGLKGFHKKVTMLRFQINGKEISNMEIYEADKY